MTLHMDCVTSQHNVSLLRKRDFFYRLVNTWPSTRIAWQANRTLASITKVLLAPNETILQKDCMTSKTNVGHYAEFFGSWCSPR